MATTPIWVPLVVAFFGLGSVLLTQHFTNRREDARSDREREHEQATWAREDAARSYEHRRAAYADFIKGFQYRRNTCSAATNEALGARGDEVPHHDYLDPLYDCLAQIEIFGTKEAADRAAQAYAELYGRVFAGTAMSTKVLRPLQREIRGDLSIPDRPDEPSTA